MRHLYLDRPKRLVASVGLAALLGAGKVYAADTADGWAHYGGSLGGDRYAAPSGITPESVERLTLAWIYRTGDATDGDGFDGNRSKFQATPILVRGKLIASTGFNRVFAVDAGTGEEVWTFDPKVSFARSYSEMFTSRGVAAWQDATVTGGPCRARIFLGTLDARLFALDADTGIPCADFGKRGEVDLSVGIARFRKRDYSVTSPPTVVGDLVIVGSAIGDNGSAEMEPGVVRAFNVTDGTLVWAWDPVPRSDDHPGAESWARVRGNRTGGANVWSVMSADPGRDLVFLPTTSPSPDFYGGMRLGDNAFANSVVALKASSGEFVWGYQTVRHDLWDYDLASQPLLFERASADGTKRPAVAQATKTGFVFVLDRETGEPLHPVEERVVPRSDVPGEEAARTQHTAQEGTPYGMARTELMHNGRPCLEGPWSTLAAVDLDEGEIRWERPAGTVPSVNSGGPMVTAGGVVFLATTYDKMLRAYDGTGGDELWARELPAGAHSTPMGYRHDGMDYVVVTAGADLASGRGRGDHVIAFRLASDTPSDVKKDAGK